MCSMSGRRTKIPSTKRFSTQSCFQNCAPEARVWPSSPMTIGIFISAIESSNWMTVRSSGHGADRPSLSHRSMGPAGSLINRCESKLWSDEALHLSASDVHVWHTSLVLADSLLLLLTASLSPEERARAERFAFDDARRRFIAAHGMLRTIVSRYVNERPETLMFTL